LTAAKHATKRERAERARPGSLQQRRPWGWGPTAKGESALARAARKGIIPEGSSFEVMPGHLISWQQPDSAESLGASEAMSTK
jgi:hypothetical protein